MSSPRLICKSGYIDNPLHLMNTLEYAGNKIASQQILYQDGSIRNVPADKIVTLSPAELVEVYSIRLNYKDGGGKTISYEKYLEHTSETREMIRVSELNTMEDDAPLLTNADGKQYHEIEELDFFKYLDYIAKREGVQKEDGHGLFGFSGDGLSGNIPIEQARAMAEQHQDSRAWSHIISLDTTAAAAAGYDNRAAWKDLIVSKAPVIADAYNISLENPVLNCAYHGNTDNPHAHLVFYSKDKREGYIKGGKPAMLKATKKLKSTFHNEIFKDDTRAVEVHKTELRKELQISLDRHLENCLVKGGVDEALGEQLLKLAERFKDIPGRKQYGYLPADLKIAVDDILRGIIQRDQDLKAMFDSYCGLQQELIGGYVAKPDTIAKKMATFQSRFFHPGRGDLRIYHNAIVACADELAEAPTLFARAVREEICDSTPPDASLSTANSQAEDTFTPGTDAEAHDFARAVRGEIRNSTPQDASVSTHMGKKAKLIFEQMKPELKRFRSVLYQALRQAVIENAPALFRPMEFTPEAMDTLLSGLSSPAFDLVDEKRRLLQRFSDLRNQYNFTDSGADIQQLFHRFFYGSEEKCDTLYLTELITETRDQADNICAQYNEWMRQSCLTGVYRNLLHALATMLYDQSNHANQAAQASRRTAFSSQKQFKNRRTLELRQQFGQDEDLSYSTIGQPPFN